MDKADCLVERYESSEPFFNFGLRDYFKHKMYYWGELRYDVSDVHKPTHEAPSTLHCLNRVYPNAIEIGQPVAQLPKWRMGIAVVVCIFMVGMWLVLSPDNYSLGDMLHWSVFIALLPVYLGLLTVWYAYRLNNMEGRQTVLFNRKTRQVIAYQIREPGFFKFWDTGKAQIKVLPWKNFRVRVYFCSEGRGNQYTLLGLFWSQREDPEKLREVVRIYDEGASEGVGYSFQLWEHIRQYMEEQGPPMQPGEQLAPDSKQPSPFPDSIIRKAGRKTYDPDQIHAMADNAND